MILVCEVVGLVKPHIRRGFGHAIDIGIDAINEAPREQEIGRHDDFLVAELQRHFEAAAHGGIGDPGIDRLGPAKAQIFGDDPGQAGGLGIGQRVRRATAHHDQHRVVKVAVMNVVNTQCLQDARLKRRDHLLMQAQFAAVADG